MAVIDYTPFDIPEISMMAFYPQRVWAPPPDGAEDVMVPAAPGVDLSARFYKHDASAPTILFFHGNGEVAYMYDDIAPHYHRAGANFFAVDFRGYGGSGGSPSFSTMIADANTSFEFVTGYLREAGFTGPLFVKGRSLGTHAAIEAAARHGEELRGLIIESGSAAMDRMAGRYGLDPESPAIKETLPAARGESTLDYTATPHHPRRARRSRAARSRSGAVRHGGLGAQGDRADPGGGAQRPALGRHGAILRGRRPLHLCFRRAGRVRMSTADFSTRFAGPFAEGDLALLIDSRGRQYLITLGAGQVFHSHFGAVPHDEIIGRDQGARVRSASGKMVIALKPSLSDYVMNMPRHSQIIYPKDAAAILFYGDMYPGATVFEAGLGSGALALALLRAVGPAGKLISYETRPDPLAGGPRNVERYLGESPQPHRPRARRLRRYRRGRAH